MYKKRPGWIIPLSLFIESNIPLSRRSKQKWETENVDPLALGDAPKIRKRYRDSPVFNKHKSPVETFSYQMEASPSQVLIHRKT